MTEDASPCWRRIIPPPPPGWACWENLMNLALEQAALAKAQGEVPVGAIVVNKAGKILSRAGNTPVSRHNPAGHAEINAISEAGANLGNYRLNGCTLIVTLEPCLMCAAACAYARLAGVVYGARDAKAGAVESRMETLELPFLNHRPWHMGGIAAEACSRLLEVFFAERRER